MTVAFCEAFMAQLVLSVTNIRNARTSGQLEPLAGLQVPAGTVENGETPEDAARRDSMKKQVWSNLRFVGAWVKSRTT